MKTQNLVIMPLLASALFVLTAFFEMGKETERIKKSTGVLVSFGTAKDC